MLHRCKRRSILPQSFFCSACSMAGRSKLELQSQSQYSAIPASHVAPVPRGAKAFSAYPGQSSLQSQRYQATGYLADGVGLSGVLLLEWCPDQHA